MTIMKTMVIKEIIRTSEPSRPPSKSAEELGQKPPLTIRKVIISSVNLKIILVKKHWNHFDHPLPMS